MKGIFKMHVIEVSGLETKLWRSCTFQKMALPDIHLKPNKDSRETESQIVRLAEIEEGQMNKPEEGLTPIPYEKVNKEIRLRYMRRAIARAHLCACLKHWRRAKKARLV